MHKFKSEKLAKIANLPDCIDKSFEYVLTYKKKRKKTSEKCKRGHGLSMDFSENAFLAEADRKHFATPAFNYSDIWEFQAIIEAAQEERARVYVASNMRVAQSIGLPYLGAWGAVAYERTGGCIYNHLDHSSSVELCKQAVDSGYMSVMIDASMEPLEENIRKTREVVEYAHARGVLVEAEIGRILGRNEEGTYGGDNYLVRTADAVEMAERTGVDSLAVGIGTAHGFYREEPHIDLQRLKEVNAAVHVPLVLHGGTGVPEEIVRACIENGMAKVNVGTQLHATYIKILRERLERFDSTNISDLMEPVREEIKAVVKRWIRICGANGRVQ